MNFNRLLPVLFTFVFIFMVSCSNDEVEDENELPILERSVWFSEKIWCHRVNTIEKVKRLDHLWKGFEIDIVFENDKLMVKHDIEDTTTLTLQQLMEAMEDSHSHYFWFDLKNIGPDNYVALSSSLVAVIKLYSSINDCIIESWMPGYMSGFVDEGCHTSFFINLTGMNTAEEVEERIKSINRNVVFNRISAISSNIYDYDMMKQYFPDFNKLTWYSNTNQSIIDSLRNVMAEDITMQVCLFEEDFY